MKTRRKAPTKMTTAGTVARQKELQSEAYRRTQLLSKENLRDEIGLLLWFLCSPLNRRQNVAGWRLLEVLYGQYLSAKSGEMRA